MLLLRERRGYIIGLGGYAGGAVYNAKAAMAATAPRATTDWENWREEGAAPESRNLFEPALAAPTGTIPGCFSSAASVLEVSVVDDLVLSEVALLPEEEALD